jgi:hypothetical protein
MPEDTSPFIVGPGIANAMEEDSTAPASDEIGTRGGRDESQWTDAMGKNGTLYRYVRATNTVYRFPAR